MLSSVTGSSAVGKSEHSKLVSLLALAAGAAALPQTSHADIIWMDLSGSPITVGSTGINFYAVDVPGAELGFYTRAKGSTSLTSIRYVSAGKQNGYIGVKDNAGGFVSVAAAGAHWGTIAGKPYYSGGLGAAKFYAHSPNSYSGKYLAFVFRDSTISGSPLRYGWVGLNLSNGNLSTGEFPQVTITGYAYDDTGAQIAMGATPVPEPSAMALMALGALTLGAAGVRSWRHNRQDAQNSKLQVPEKLQASNSKISP